MRKLLSLGIILLLLASTFSTFISIPEVQARNINSEEDSSPLQIQDKQLTFGEGYDILPLWSPDGLKLIFLRMFEGPPFGFKNASLIYSPQFSSDDTRILIPRMLLKSLDQYSEEVLQVLQDISVLNVITGESVESTTLGAWKSTTYWDPERAI